jgi:hypothetical protein
VSPPGTKRRSRPNFAASKTAQPVDRITTDELVVRRTRPTNLSHCRDLVEETHLGDSVVGPRGTHSYRNGVEIANPWSKGGVALAP